MGRLVVDASAVVAALTEPPAGERVRFVFDHLTSHTCCASAVLPFEVVQALRRLEQSGIISNQLAGSALATLMLMPIARTEFELIATRVWELRVNLSSYDASYVAVAELLDVPLLTLDEKLAAASGPRCEIRTPPTS